jgi:hypothetical protein
MGRSRSYLFLGVLAALLLLITIHARPYPISTELAVIDKHYEVEVYDQELAKRQLARLKYIFFNNGDAILKAGACMALGCYQNGDTKAAEGIGIVTGLLSLIASVGKSWTDFDIPAPPLLPVPGTGRRRSIAELNLSGNTEWLRFTYEIDNVGLHDDLQDLYDFSSGHMDQMIIHAPSGDVQVERRQVVHPIKRDMRSVVRLKVHPIVEEFGKRQEGYYGIEAFVAEESDYGYPPDNGWLGEAANQIGNGVHDYHTEGASDMCVKITNFDGAVSHTYMKYDGTPDDEQFDSVFGCDTTDY